MQTRARELFQSVHAEGGLLPADLLRRIAEGDPEVPGLTPDSYHLTATERLGEAVSRAWNRLLGAWAAFDAARTELPPMDTGSQLTRERWLQVLFDELSYGRLVKRPAVDIDGKSYPIFTEWQHTPIHLVGCNVAIDRRSPGVAGAAGQSPHSLVQELLNRSPERLWGIVSNGLRLRLLRDNVALTRQAYVEFDLEAMMTGEAYSDFVLLWLVCHQSRVEGERPDSCWLERWTKIASDQGARALDALRTGVEEAIATLGSGFLAHPQNRQLQEALRSGELDAQDYYRQLLRLVYRLLFLFVVEDREALLDPGSSQGARERYLAYYSTRRLRRLADKRRGGPQHDLYSALNVVMDRLSSAGCEPLGLPALGSYLWSRPALGALGGARLANRDLLAALRALAWVEERGVRRPVDFRNLGAEELGSVYESLLELRPELHRETAGFTLESATGSERRTTGSYYTATPLITALLDSALDPLLDATERSGDTESAILALKVCDPACGSGHFLIAAASRIAKRLAAVRTGEAAPTPDALRHALRDVIGHCLYGVDQNPMAVELCRVALWVEAIEPGRPLSFLDAHVKCGNALIGALPGLVEGGIPDDVFQSIRGDDFGQLDGEDKTYVTQLRKRNKAERDAGLGAPSLFDPDVISGELSATVQRIAGISDENLTGVETKEREYAALVESGWYRQAKLVADVWCAAALAEKRADRPQITQGTLNRLLMGGGELAPDLQAMVGELREDYQFFHWHLEFPDVFETSDEPGDARHDPGFDLMLGNPPWDTLSPDAKEFFAAWEPRVRSADRDGQRAIIGQLVTDVGIADAWRTSCRRLYAGVHFFKNSGRYRMFAPGSLGKGDFNVYRMFTESALTLARNGGVAAQVVPENLYNGGNAAAIRRALFEDCELAVLLAFENAREVWFKGIHSSTSFCVYVARKGGMTEAVPAAFSIRSPEGLSAASSQLLHIPLSVIREFSPDALAVMRFDSQAEIDTVAKAYARWPKFGDASAGEPYREYMREIDMGNDRERFSEDADGLPLYEGRMVWQYDHRAKGYRSGRGRAAVWETLSFDSPIKSIQPQWRIPYDRIPPKAIERTGRYRLGFCDVASPTNERSLVACLLPAGAISSDTVPTITFPAEHEWQYMLWLACANTFIVDFIVRKKIALHLKYSMLDTVPFPRLPPGADEALARVLVPLAARLTCTGAEMIDYWNRLARDGWVPSTQDGTIPGELTEDRRAELRASIDAIVARDIYGLERSELEFVLGTFPTARKYEERDFGEFRSRRLVLEAYDAVVPRSSPYRPPRARLETGI
jgi:hypothetical protein